MKNTTDFNGNGSGTMKPFDRLSRWTLSQRVDTQTKARPRQDNRKRKCTFFALTLFKKKKNKKELPPLNFSSRFLSPSSFSTFASRAVLFVEKFTNKTCTPFGKLAKELNPSRQTKTSAKKISIAPIKKYFVILGIMANSIKNITMVFQPIFLSVLISLATGCSKDKQMVIENNWQVESIKVHADSALQHPAQGKIYTLTFEDKKSYILKLDVNKCSGKVKFKSNNSIDFTDTGCTEICCDSDFAKNIIYILNEVEKYQLTDSTLILSTKNNKVINLKEM